MVIGTDTRLNQVKTSVLKFVKDECLERGHQLPSEARMAEILGVSRNTLREAYISLENEGVIIRRHGIGTFVANLPLIQDSLNDFLPFANIILKKGYTPHFKTLDMCIKEGHGKIAKGLKVKNGMKIRCIERLVLADQKPVIYVLDFLAPILEKYDIDWHSFDGNLVQFISRYVKTPLHQIKSNIRAATLDEDTSQYLKLSLGTPVLSVQSTIFSLDNKPIVYSKIYFNSDIVELTTVRLIPKT